MINILITESGGPAAIGLIKSIRSSKYDVTILATDMNKLSAGGKLADKSFTVSPAKNQKYLSEILDLVIKHKIDLLKIDLIIPTGEHDLAILSLNKEIFKKSGCSIFISDCYAIQTCQDKSRFYKFLNSKEGIKLPSTLSGPFVKKPIKGSGSRDVEISRCQNTLVQEYINGDEYTVDVFCDMNSNIISHVIRQRISIKSGISVVGRIVKNNKITEQVKNLVNALKLRGPSCIQFIVDKYSVPYLIECNPRLGGGTYMSTLAGVNCADIYFDLFNKKIVDKIEAKEITVTRYFEEIVV